MKFREFSALIILCIVITLIGCSSGIDFPDDTTADLPVGRIIEAASPSQEDVQAAIDQAEDGDIVLVPAGTATWSTDDANKSAVVIDKKGINLMGAGVGKTTILGGYAIYVNGGRGNPFRISGFSFRGANIVIGGDCLGWRIDNCDFYNESGMTSIYTNGYTRGVIDHNSFLNCRVLVKEDNYGISAWKRPLRLGTADAVYLEDNHYRREVHGNSIDANSGGQYVFRYNEVINSSCEAHSLQNAWADSGTFERATRSYEIYNNEFIADEGKSNWGAVFVRGGTGVIYDNTIENLAGDPYNLFVAVDNLRSFTTCAAPLLKADGTNLLDGNEDETGYPALDQIGRSTDNGDGDNYHPQAHEPLYVWGNTMDGNSAGAYVHNTSREGSLVAEHIKENRDFYHQQHPTYTAYTYPHPVANGSTLELRILATTSLQIGQQYSIRWQAEEDIVVGNISVDLYQGSKKIIDIANVDVSDGEYTWTVPESLNPGKHYRVRIFQGAIQDISSEIEIID
ncbi:MAG: Ser-Thr-rich GPI-anchored membrane family protein [Halanaerobiales bacterium]